MSHHQSSPPCEEATEKARDTVKGFQANFSDLDDSVFRLKRERCGDVKTASIENVVFIEGTLSISF